MSEIATVDGSEARQVELFGDLERVTQLPPGSLRLTGLYLVEPDMPLERWHSLGRALGAMRRWTGFAIGDWLLYGIALYGEDEALQATEAVPADRYDVASRITGLRPETLKNYERICAAIPLERRHPALDFSMHEPVAALEPEEQDEWLQRAVDEGWDRAQLRDAIRESRVPPGAPVPVLDEPTLSPLERAARVVLTQAQPTGTGEFLVPGEAIAQLHAALDEE